MHPSTTIARSTTYNPVSLKTKGVQSRETFDGFVSWRIAAHLGRFHRRIRRVDVWVEDLNGPRGGIDTRCRIEVRLRPHGLLTVAAQAVDEYAAITTAANRARTLLIRRCKKVRSRQ